MFGFLRRKKTPPAGDPASAAGSAPAAPEALAPAVDAPVASEALAPAVDAPAPHVPPAPSPAAPHVPPAAGAARDATARPAAAGLAPGATSHIAAPTELYEARRPGAQPEEATRRSGWMARLRGGLSRTRGNLAGLFGGRRVDESLFEDLETALLASDAGPTTTDWLLRQLRQRVRDARVTEPAQVRQHLKDLLVELLTPLEKGIDIDAATPLVMMIAGVNGAGKTTSIGKLARHLRTIGQSVLLAAGDTFRAAAREQLVRWGERNDVQVIASDGGDPSAIAFDAVKAGIARRTGVVMIDTAGRLPTQMHLMDELGKVRRVLGKAMPGAPHEVLLVLDGNTGQNMLAQVEAFDRTVGLTGLIVTKLDGTAKGGAIAALAHVRRDRPLPVYFIGVGEAPEDLEAFSAREFASALID